MRVSGWRNKLNGVYGIYVGNSNRTQFFKQTWTEIQVESPTSCIAGGMMKPPRRGRCCGKAPKGAI